MSILLIVILSVVVYAILAGACFYVVSELLSTSDDAAVCLSLVIPVGIVFIIACLSYAGTKRFFDRRAEKKIQLTQAKVVPRP